ncbi:winged helix-turn-helix transcriptional regulator [Xenorhabdus griffiniae]|uniref:Helix-turn-helix domain-containing protein n=1 Tax=Xenorhabdus griffiniae TaxID=351672 RepID=A0ABY9XFB5_9GAMM|nr:helix-turn-helix domain-containing protein [Xenorhabdus griffiniae]MBD1229576.1 helix-turn-helix transcriptional regulator [Xenorhabdus griffiniae]MBE8589344.1 helix-turn-helix transcriptional regulator [Xenorhabdus griffiniae]WMV71611.1 helix-turn-helix domain-containing protein [Xenorhabdus griffiniae]WNH01288.1 helix-turn-helix domain-containing protein [Xenorhabdus griffiniae]
MVEVTKGGGCQVSLNGKSYPCPVSMAMDLIGGKWKGVILYYLKDKSKRFSELKKDIPHITEMTLSIQLKKLEKDGLVLREVYGNKPPIKVIYSLTDFGESLKPVLEAISAWSHEISGGV